MREFPPLTPLIKAGLAAPIAPEHRRVIDMQGRPVSRPIGSATLRSVAGPLVPLPTGRLVVVDVYGLTDPDTNALELSLQPGEYPTQVLLAGEPLDDRVAFAVLWVRPRQPARFIPAPRSDEAGERLGRGEAFAAGCDSWYLCFADHSVCRNWQAVMARDRRDPRWNLFLDRVRKVETIGAVTEDGIGLLAAFFSGFGAGIYSKAWGVDDNGDPVCLVVDLDVVQSDIISNSNPANRRWWRFGL